MLDPPDLRQLPLCTNSELDGGPYVNTGLHITRNPTTGVRNVGVQRNMYQEPALLGIYMAPTHMFQHYLQMEARDEPLPVAIAVGTHPALMVASQMRIAFDERDGRRRRAGRAPVELVRCRTVPLRYPRTARSSSKGKCCRTHAAARGPSASSRACTERCATYPSSASRPSPIAATQSGGT